MRLLAGLALLVAPAWFLFTAMVPVPQYRVGGIVDFMPAIRACLVLYGGAIAGFAAVLLTSSTPAAPGSIFRACFLGSMLGIVLAIVIAGGGNLWGLVFIFGAAFSAIIALGVRLVYNRREGSG